MLAFPDATAPRLLVPGFRLAAASSVRRYSAALSLPEVLTRAGAARLLGWGGARFWPRHVTIGHGPEPAITDHLAEILGGRVVVSVGIGSDRVNRKPVLGVFRPDGTQLAYVKVGHNDYTTSLVNREAAALTALARKEVDLEAPRVISLGNWNDLTVLVMTAVPTGGWVSSRTGWTLARQVHDQLNSRFTGESRRLAETSLWSRLSEGVAAQTFGADTDRWTRLLRRAEAAVADTDVAVGAWHGDLTPWNLGGGGSRVKVWDWERFESGVPVGMDLAHYLFRSAGRHGDYTISRARSVIEKLPVSNASLTVMTYLLTITSRFLEGSDRVDLSARRAAMVRSMLDTIEEILP